MASLFRKNNRKRRGTDLGKGNILNPDSPFSVRESYNTIRANILFSVPSQGCKIIGVTSGLATEGKSINCLNLAIAFGEIGAKVILLDCDFRLPMVARLLGQKTSPGLSNVVVGLKNFENVQDGEMYLEDVINPVFPTLDVIPAGNIPPDPSVLLGSERMGEILSELSEQYDYIFIDTPPVNVVSDAVVMSKYMTGLVFIVKQGESEKASVVRAVDQLKFAGAKVLGFVLNGVPEQKRGRYNKYYKYGE